MKTAITNGRSFKIFGKYVCSVLLYTLLALPVLSQTIGEWNFNATLTGTGTANNTVSTADFSGGIPTRSFNSSVEYFGENGWPSGALDPNAYLQFSISPNTGYQLDLSSIVMRIRRSTTGTPSGSGPTSWSLRSSLDGFTANIASNNLVTSYLIYTVPLGASFLNQYSTITFRLYGFNSAAPADGRHRFVIDNISIQGIGEVLPLSLTGIQALRNNEKAITVKWQMSNVQEGTVFNVQRSVNGVDFTTLNSLTANDYKASASYNYLDDKAPAVSQNLYYRVQGVMPSGRTFLSPVVKIGSRAATQAVIDYTAVQGQSLLTSLQIPEKGLYSLSIIGLNGVVLHQRSIEPDAGVHVITLPLNALAHGTYVVRLTNSKVTSSKKFVW